MKENGRPIATFTRLDWRSETDESGSLGSFTSSVGPSLSLSLSLPHVSSELTP